MCERLFILVCARHISIISIKFKFLLLYIDERFLMKLAPQFLCLSLWIFKSKKKKVKDGLPTVPSCRIRVNECLVAIATLQQSPALYPYVFDVFYKARS